VHLTNIEKSNHLSNPTGSASNHAEPWINFHDRIKPISKPFRVKNSSPSSKKSKRPLEEKDIRSSLRSDQSKISAGINKNAILSEYQEPCIIREIHNKVSTNVKGENPSNQYPLHYRLISECRMKPSRNLQYRVKNLHFDNILVFLIKNQDAYLTDVEINSLKDVNRMYQKMINDILQLRSIDFSTLKLPRFDYTYQTKISLNRVDLATACTIYYGLNTGFVIQYLKGKYVGESRNANAILKKVSPYICDEDCQHIKRIIDQGCPSYINFKEDYENKHIVLWKGSKQTFLQFLEVTAKAMNKEKKNSHVLSFRQWLVHFLPYCHATPQGIREKYRKHRVIFDSSTQTSRHEIILNHKTSMDNKAIMDFGKAKTKLLANIYNW
jgi:hypothetical protein